LTIILRDGLILLYICALQVCGDDADDVVIFSMPCVRWA